MNAKKGAVGIRWAQWLLSACTLLLAALLIFQCADIYRIGTAPENLTETGVRIFDIYTREEVARRLSGIAWAFWLWAAALAAAVACRMAWPLPQSTVKPEPELQQELLASRRQASPAMMQARSKRRKAGMICGAVCLLCAGASLAYLLDPHSFASRDLEPVMGQMLLHVGPWVLAAFSSLMSYVQFRRQSICKELSLAKEAPLRTEEPVLPKKNDYTPILRAALFLTALALVIAGILNGGMFDVLVKAVNICTECIGLG